MEKIIINAKGDEGRISFFLGKKPDELEKMRELLESRGFENIRAIAAIIKGYSKSLGFKELTEIGDSLIRAAFSGDVDEIKNLLKRMSDYLDRVEVIYE